MKLIFNRSYPFHTELGIGNGRQARFFVFKIGVRGTVDTDSGMMADLVELDQKAEKLLALKRPDLESELALVLALYRDFLALKFDVERVEIEEPSRDRAWSKDQSGEWHHQKNWVTLQDERKVFLLQIQSTRAVFWHHSYLDSYQELESKILQDPSQVFHWTLEEPVTGMSRGN